MSAEDLAYRVARRFTAAERVASRYFERKYALDLNRMTVPEAKKILGLPAGAVTKEELNKAYRSKAIENHPDRGGDHMKMVEINVAKDKVLKDLESGGSGGKWAPPSWDGAGPYKRDPRPPKWQDDPETKIVEGQPFAQAWSSSGAPPNTEWKFVSNPVYYWGPKSFYPSHAIWVLYGTTETKHVFLAFKRRAESNGVIPTDEHGPKTHFNEDWQSSSVELPIGQPALKVIPKYIKSLATSWADGASPSKFPTKFTAWPGGHPTETILNKIHHRGGVTLKDILLGTGVVQEGSPGVGDRKTQVEVITRYNQEKSKANREALHAKKIPHFSVIHQYDFFVRVNGKEQILAQDTLEKMEKKFIPWVIGWDKIDDNRVFNLTKKRGGFLKMDAATSILALVECLTSEPSWVHIGLEKAAEEYESESKTASLFRIASEMSHEDAAKQVGLSPYDLFRAMLG